MNTKSRPSGSKVIEFGVMAAVIAIITSAAAPQQPPSGLATNEAAAIASLRWIAAAETNLQASGQIDSDCDGIGEYGYLAELAGTSPKRVCFFGIPVEGNPSSPADHVHPPLLRPQFSEIDWWSATVSGYRFQLWLPYFEVYSGLSQGLPEDFTGGKCCNPFPDPRRCAHFWCCYAWPVAAGITGSRAFFVNQEGVVLQCDNDSTTPYTGVHKMPGFGEAYLNSRDMASGLRIGPPMGGGNHTIWTRVWQ